jgi:outer membrane protein assembly factor BamB
MKIFMYLLSILTLSGCFNSPSNGGKDEDQALKILWNYAYDLDGGAPRALPIIHNDRIVTSGDINVTSLDFKTGELVWKTPFEHHRQLLNQSFGLNDNVLVGSIARSLLAWNIQTGASLWKVDISDSLSFNNSRGIHSVPDGFVAVSNGPRLYKLDRQGEMEIIELDARSYESTYVDGVLYVGQVKDSKGVVSAYHLDTMELIWRFEPGNYGFPVFLPPIVENEIVYIGTAGGPTDSRNGFFALNAATGQEIWRREEIFTYSAILVGDRIFGVNGNNVWALNKMTGQLLWSTNSLGGGHSNNNLVFMDGHVYWAHGSGLHVFNEVSGELVHVEPAPDKTTFQLITANKGRIFAQSSRHLYAFAPWGHEEAIE